MHLSCDRFSLLFISNFFHWQLNSTKGGGGVNRNNIIDNRDTFRNLPRGKLNVTLSRRDCVRRTIILRVRRARVAQEYFCTSPRERRCIKPFAKVMQHRE